MFTDSAIKKNKNNNKEASAFLHFTAKFPVQQIRVEDVPIAVSLQVFCVDWIKPDKECLWWGCMNTKQHYKNVMLKCWGILWKEVEDLVWVVLGKHAFVFRDTDVCKMRFIL